MMGTRRLIGGCAIAICLAFVALGVVIVRDDRTTFILETLFMFAVIFEMLALLAATDRDWPDPADRPADGANVHRAPRQRAVSGL